MWETWKFEYRNNENKNWFFGVSEMGWPKTRDLLIRDLHSDIRWKYFWRLSPKLCPLLLVTINVIFSRMQQIIYTVFNLEYRFNYSIIPIQGEDYFWWHFTRFLWNIVWQRIVTVSNFWFLISYNFFEKKIMSNGLPFFAKKTIFSKGLRHKYNFSI